MIKHLTTKEYEIMKYFWENEDGLSFGEIHNYMNSLGKELKRQTVNTHLQHLIDKRLIKAEGLDRKRIYYPLMSKKIFDSTMAKNVVEQLFDGSLKKFISALTGRQSLSEKEVKELKELLKKDNLVKCNKQNETDSIDKL